MGERDQEYIKKNFFFYYVMINVRAKFPLILIAKIKFFLSKYRKILFHNSCEDENEKELQKKRI